MAKLFDENISGVSQLIASPRQWATQMWKDGCANHWLPQEVPMLEDKKQWSITDPTDRMYITPAERKLIMRTLGLFAAGESLVSNSVVTVENVCITDGACRQYLLRKAFEESLHNFTVTTCCETFSLDVDEVAEAYLNIPSIKAKDEFLMKSLDSFKNDALKLNDIMSIFTEAIRSSSNEEEQLAKARELLSEKMKENFDIKTKAGKQKFIKNMFIFYMAVEGTWFYANFALVMSLKRQGKLKGLGQQIEYTARDESLHAAFGEKVINETRIDYPEIWTKKFEQELVDIMKEAIEIEFTYCDDILSDGGILGVTVDMLKSFVLHIGDLRLESVGLPRALGGSKESPFPWLNELLFTSGESAFFEDREKNYQSASNLEDDF